MKKFILFLFASNFAFFNLAISQGQNETKTFDATRVEQGPKIDGLLDDAVWQNILVAKDFIQNSPLQNVTANQQTEVKIIYDDRAIYVAARMYDSNPDSILKQLGLRDSETNSDFFRIGFDTYLDKQNLIVFGLSASGIQRDFTKSDRDFDAIWDGKVRIDSLGWTAEMKIPYSALRFPKKNIQEWGMQIERNVRRTRENSIWQFVPNGVDNEVALIGRLTGLEDITPPTRLFLRPNLTATVNHFPVNEAGKSNFGSSYNAGLDVKYGINESFTLDMTLAPDFGQVRSDNEVLNLSPFEQFFQENRPFFKEEMDLFNQYGNFFYSRRIGGRPIDFSAPYQNLGDGEEVIDNPNKTQLLNATKISGRTPDGLGLGVLNAITDETRAVIRDSVGNTREVVTSPITNFNVVSMVQTLPANSSFKIINTNVNRFGRNDNANATLGNFTIGTKDNKYAFSGGAGATINTMETDTSIGHTYFVRFDKVSGNWQGYIRHGVESDTYNPNDLGILFANNESNFSGGIKYHKFEPFWNGRFIRGNIGINNFLGTSYDKKQFLNYSINLDGFVLDKSFMAAFFWANIRPIRGWDIFEARVPGRQFHTNAFAGGGFGFSTDYRKVFALDGRFQYYADLKTPYNNNSITISPRVRVSDNLSFNYSYNLSNAFQIGFANFDNTGNVIFGDRNVNTHTNTLSAKYIFTTNMSLALDLRQYWSKVEYNQYFDLLESGDVLKNNTYAQNNNVNFNRVNLDLVYTWRFAPGSDLFFTYKNSIADFSNDLNIAQNSVIKNDFANNVINTINQDQLNTFSIKVVYYLDYLYLKRNK
ncbi:MAG: hypothetical protein ACJATA_000866 [Sphingobacteriales bacterium]|jgi:hypothetical protein